MDTAWAYQRRARVKWALLGILFIALVVYLSIKLYTPPTCFDGKRNQEELGKDCGGSCRLLCPFQTNDLTVDWTRVLEVSPGLWTAVAYLQNTNYDTYAYEAPYRFTLYDTTGRSITEREGTTFVGGEPAMAIIESRIEVGDAQPYRASFEWLAQPSFYTEERVRGVGIAEHQVRDLNVGVEVFAVIRNEQPVEVKNLEVQLIVYDASQNAIAASETYVDYIAPRSMHNVSFTWPTKFPSQPSRLEFIPRIPIQH